MPTREGDSNTSCHFATSQPLMLTSRHKYRPPTKSGEGNFSLVFVLPWGGVGISGPMTFMGEGWVSLVQDSFLGVCPGLGMSRGCMGPGILWYTVDKQTIHILLECFLITICKSSCGKVMFSQVCIKNSVQGRGGMCGRGVCVAGGVLGRGHAWRGGVVVCVTGVAATVAVGRHPTGMQSCSLLISTYVS